MAAGAAEPLLSRELAEQLGADAADAANQAVIAARPPKKRKSDAPPQSQPTRRNKRQRRGEPAQPASAAPPRPSKQQIKLQKLEEARRRKEEHEAMLISLRRSRVSEKQARLLAHSAGLGQRRSLKQRLRAALLARQAGIPLSAEEEELLARRRRVAEGSGEEEEEEEESGEDEESQLRVGHSKARGSGDTEQERGKGEDEEEGRRAEEDRASGTSNKRGEVRAPPARAPEISFDLSVGPVALIRTRAAAKERKREVILDVRSEAKSGERGALEEGVGSEERREDVVDEREDAARDPDSLSSILSPNPPRLTIATEEDGVAARVSNNEVYRDSAPAAPAPQTRRGPAPFRVQVKRPAAIAAARSQLPIMAQEAEVVEAIVGNPVSVVCGATGCGKTTQVPQFLYEMGFGAPEGPRPGMIGVTQPRRVAAVSTARRVAEELGLGFEREVAYQVRYDSRVGPETRIKFMTDGILLREIQGDFLLRNYSAVIIDEAHERNVNTDVLIGLLSRIVPLRSKLHAEEVERQRQQTERTGAAAGDSRPSITPLRLVIMSATLRVSDFVSNSRLFAVPPPVVEVEARQYPVTIHFNRATPLDGYLDEAFGKVCKVHKRLPPGGILVFLTGRHEIEGFCKRLRRKFPAPESGSERALSTASAWDSQSNGAMHGRGVSEADAAKQVAEEHVFSLGEGEIAAEDDHVAAERGATGDEDDDASGTSDVEGRAGAPKQHKARGVAGDSAEAADEDEDPDAPEFGAGPVRVLPLYSLLPAHMQLRVFERPPEGVRLVVVATNVAETSLTIPDIKYVIDAGREKARVYDKMTGASRFEVTWISKASAAQRAGRAGRTAPGHCYRLYSSAVFDQQFSEWSAPEILRAPVESVVLQMKSMGVERLADFPFPTPPDAASLSAATRTLLTLGALSPVGERITAVGRGLAYFPVAPRFAKVLLLADQGGCLPFAVAVVAAQSAEELFVDVQIRAEESDDEVGQERSGATNARQSGGTANAGPAADDGNGVRDADESSESEGEPDEASGERLRHALARDVAARRAKKKAEAMREAAEKAQQHKLFELFRAARAKFFSVESDALTGLRVVAAFQDACAAGDSASFCRRHFLRAKSLEEVQSLRLQLTRLTNALAAARGGPRLLDERTATSFGGLPRPSPAQEALLRQLLLAGLLDRVARRLSPEEVAQASAAARSRGDEAAEAALRFPKRLGAVYESAWGDEPCFIHPSSAVAQRASPPDWIVFSERVTSSRCFLRGVTVIEADWLFRLGAHLCTVSQPLEAPAPRFDRATDAVRCWVRVTFGPRNWVLPLQDVAFPEGIERVRHFARLLLDGSVVQSLVALRPFLAARPSALLQAPKSERCKKLVAALEKRAVDSRARLAEALREDRAFLLPELRLWVQPQRHHALAEMWPPRELVGTAAQVRSRLG